MKAKRRTELGTYRANSTDRTNRSYRCLVWFGGDGVIIFHYFVALSHSLECEA